MADSFTWTCGYCKQPQQATALNYAVVGGFMGVGRTIHGESGLHGRLRVLACLNEQCLRPTLSATLNKVVVRGDLQIGTKIEEWRLLPASSSIPQPDYIPVALRQDYEEACRILDLSPKAAATLVRRCLQGMIRDFCGIRDKTLNREIQRLKEAVESGAAPKGVNSESVEAIDQVRSIGNIGAHMEADVNLIIDIDPDEAATLIQLVEMLFDDWYVERQKRAESLARISAIKAAKEELKAQGGVERPAVVATLADDGES